MSKKNQSKQVQLSPENYIRQKVRNLPIHNCMVNSDWESGKLATVSVARKHANGNVTVGMFLVDLNCLGVKDANYLFNIPENEYKSAISNNGQVELMDISYELAHNIIFAGLEYAKELGFNPHKDFSLVRFILEDDTEDVELIEIECGTNGKPLFMKSPWQSEPEANRIIAQLERSVGKGNFKYIISGDFKEMEEEDDDEYKDMTYDEKKVLFLQLVKSMEGDNKADHEKLSALVISAFNELVEPKLLDEWYDSYSKNMNVRVLPIEEIPFELWGVKPGELTVTDEITGLFVEAYSLVNESTKKAGKKVKELKKIVGDIPAVRVLELMITQEGGNEEESIVMRLDNYAKHPDYPIFKLQLLLVKIPGTIYPKEFRDVMPGIQTLFDNRTSLHEIEFMNYLFALIELIEYDLDATKLEALNIVIEELELPESIDEEIYNQIMTIKFKMVIEYFSNKKI